MLTIRHSIHSDNNKIAILVSAKLTHTDKDKKQEHNLSTSFYVCHICDIIMLE